MTVLYDYWRSSACHRVRIALGLAGECWDTETINLTEHENRSQDHLTRNPQGLVPVLDIDGHRLTQSLAIIEYLDETRGLGLLPSTSVAKAKVRALSHAIAMEVHPICNVGVAQWVAEHSAGHITMGDWMTQFIGKGLRAFEDLLGGGDYCHGNGVTLADICLAPQVYNAQRWGVDLTGMPKIDRIQRRLDGIPAFHNAHPDRTQPR